MRICLYTQTALPRKGGAETAVDALAREWTRTGHTVTVLAPRPGLFDRPDDSDYPYRVERHAPYFSSRHGIGWYERILLAAHRKHRFDIVHSHGFYPNAYLAARCRRQMQVPLVTTSHGGDLAPENVRYRKPAVRERIHWGMRQQDAFVAISEFARRGFLEHCPLGVRVVSIPNGIDVDAFAGPASRPFDLDAGIQPGEYFLFHGRLESNAGVSLLLQSLASADPSGNVELVIAGDGKDRHVLEGIAVAFGLSERVRFVGEVSDSTKTYLLQNALSRVVPARTRDTFSAVALESFAAGTSVLATRVPGFDEMVESERTGLLVRRNHCEDWARAMQWIREDRVRTQRLGQNAREAARQYAWSTIAHRYLDLFEQLIEERESIHYFAA